MSIPQFANWRIDAERRVGYDLVGTLDVFDPGNEALLSVGRVHGGRRFVVVDECVYNHHGRQIVAYFRHHGVNAHIQRIPGGETGKTVDTWLKILGELDDFPIHRRDEPIIAIGGGVLTDVVGFAASSYRRGIPHIRVPTTLMGYVDAAVGAKTGLNFNGHKNRLGSFEPPQRVLLDRTLLRTQDQRHLRNGLCEIIKLAVIKDAELFRDLELHGSDALAQAFQNRRGAALLDRAVAGMLEELSTNLFEAELARSVDFGHTFSYGLETQAGSRLLHGEAVLLDILISTAIANQRHFVARSDVSRIMNLISTLGIVPRVELLDAESMWHSLLDRIEHRNGLQHVPLPSPLGRCVFVDDVSLEDIEAAIRTLNNWTASAHDEITECRRD